MTTRTVIQIPTDSLVCTLCYHKTLYVDGPGFTNGTPISTLPYYCANPSCPSYNHLMDVPVLEYTATLE